MGTRDDEMLAALQALLANQRESLDMQRTALANQEEAIAQQKLAIARQASHLKLYRMVLLVGVPLVGVLVWVFFRVAGPYL